MRNTTARLATLFLILIGGSSACAITGQSDPFAGPFRAPDLTLVVQNQSPDVLLISLVMQGVAHPIGRVEGLSEARFAIGRSVSAGYDDLRVEAGPLRGDAQRWTSPRLQLDGVDIVTVLLRSQLSMSTYALSSRGARN
jgi:hypothetical protein